MIASGSASASRRPESRKQLLERIRELEERLAESEETLQALTRGEVDAIVGSGPDGDRIYTLKGADAAYRQIVEEMTEGAVMLAPDGLILFSNERFAGLLEMPLEQVIGSHLHEFIAAESADVTAALRSETSKDGKAEVRLLRSGRLTVPAYVSWKRVRQDSLDCICVIVTDLSEQKRREEIVSASKLMESILEQATETMLVTDPSGKIILASRVSERLAGVPVLMRSFDDVFHIRKTSDSEEYSFQEVLADLKGGAIVKRVETAAVTADGRVVELLLTSGHLMASTGEPMGCIISLIDITEQKRAEYAFAKLAAIVESSNDAIISKDLNGIITSWNRGAERLFGYTAAEAIGRPVTMLIPVGRLDEETAILTRIRRGESIEHYETVRRRKDGSLLDISLTISPIVSRHNQIVGASKIARDITERKRAEQQRHEMEERERALAVATALRETEAELARVARALTVGELATSIAHEVNQPLAAIVTNAEAGLRWLNAKTPNFHEAQESLELIIRDGNRASLVIRRIREFLKKESKPAASLNINEVVRESVALVADEMRKRQIMLLVELSDGIPPVRGDRIQLQQVILNLIMNGSEAMASITDGSRELLLSTEEAGTEGVLVAVKDSGAGLDIQNDNRMFEAFFTTKATGMGMGLSISRSIIEAHGGRIWAVANDGPGLTVQFTLPAGSAGNPE